MIERKKNNNNDLVLEKMKLILKQVFKRKLIDI